MKIYEIGTGYTPIPARMGAATEIVVEELTKAFIDLGEQVEIIDIAATDRVSNSLPIREVKVPKCFAGTDVKLGIMHKLKRVVYSVALAGELKKILKQNDEKVVLHFHNQYNMFFFLKLVPKRLQKKAVLAYTNHSGIWSLPWAEISKTIPKRYFQEAECMKKADVVFVLNDETAENIAVKLGIPNQRILRINNGVNTDIYRPLAIEEKAQAKAQFGLSDCKVILQVGSVYENKGQLWAAEQLLPLLKKTPNLVYAYVGSIVDETYYSQIEEFASAQHAEKQIRYLGTVSPGREMNLLYNAADVTVLPSRYEAFSLASLESLSAGTPVLADSQGPIRVGEGSVLYEKDCFFDTADQLLQADVYQMSVAARQNAVNHYSWRKVANDCLQAFAMEKQYD